ncbi:MAG: hypothetical protein LUG94_06975 [Ruminococcus sp.]|nr:hypothetical protein [Ruminococcus sp.]
MGKKDRVELAHKVEELEKQKSDEKSITQKILFATALMNFLKTLYEILDRFI